jgi:hypothetical protein
MRSHWVWVRHLYQAFQLPVCPTGSGWRFFLQGQRIACVNNTQLAFGTNRCYCILMLTILHDVMLSPGQVPPCCQSVSTSGMSGLSL